MRPGAARDKSRVLEISGQIWEGEDYVPAIIDHWLADKTGEFTVAEYDGRVMGFAKFTLLTLEDGWMEGIRVDPAARNLGIGKLITRHFVDKARSLGLKSLRLSTHVDNRESIHIIEKFGFRPDAGFAYCSRRLGVGGQKGPERSPAQPVWQAQPVSPVRPGKVQSRRENDQVVEYVLASEFCRCARGYLPMGWKFQKADAQLLEKVPDFADVYWVPGDAAVDGPRDAAAGAANHKADDPAGGSIAGIMIIARTARVSDELPIFVLEGERLAQELLVDHALGLAERGNFRFLEYMAPQGHSSLATAIAGGMREHCEGKAADEADVFVYEYPLDLQIPS